MHRTSHPRQAHPPEDTHKLNAIGPRPDAWGSWIASRATLSCSQRKVLLEVYETFRQSRYYPDFLMRLQLAVGGVSGGTEGTD
jgi:hypothetical protein